MQNAVERVDIIISTGAQEAEQAGNERIDELSMNGERRPSVASQLMSQIQELQNKVNSLTDERDFTNLRERTALEPPTFPADS